MIILIGVPIIIFLAIVFLVYRCTTAYVRGFQAGVNATLDIVVDAAKTSNFSYIRMIDKIKNGIDSLKRDPRARL